MSVATERKGQAAAPGLALAPLEELLPTLPPGSPAQEKADPDAERSRLEQAIRAAIGGLNALVAQADSEAGNPPYSERVWYCEARPGHITFSTGVHTYELCGQV